LTPAVTNDVDVLAPASTSVQCQGEQVVVAPLKVGVIPQVIRELRPIIQRLRPQGGEEGLGDLEISMGLVLDLLEHNAGNLFAAVGLCVGKAPQFVEACDPAELLQLVLTVVEVNRDFFTERLAPLLATVKLTALGAGATPSSS